jgi:hypothetical protein
MPNAAITFAPNQQSGLDSLGAGIELAVNVIIDKAGTVRRRPGIALFPGAPNAEIDASGLDGIHVTVGGVVYVAGGTPGSRRLYRIAGGSSFDLSGSASGLLVGPGRPVFAETEALVAIAASGAPQKILLADDSSSRLAGSPPTASHILSNASRLLANHVDVDLNRLNWSDLASGTSFAGHETWVGGDSGFLNAEGRPDPVLAIAENANEVFLFGSTSLQVYAPSASDVYSPVSTREVGCIAPYSVTKYDNTFVWLDHRRRVIQSDGRSVQVLSEQIQQTLDEMTVVSDCFGVRIDEGPCQVILLVFPSDGRSFAFQIGGGWSEWMGWDDLTSNFSRLAINGVAANPLTGENLVATTTGYVGVLDLNAQTDLGSPIAVRILTGFENRGTDEVKQCLSVRLAFRRGTVGQGGVEPTAWLSWRDDEGEWSPPLEIGLGEFGDRSPVVSLRGLGTYRRRQWRLEFDGATDFILAGATEEFTVVEE